MSEAYSQSETPDSFSIGPILHSDLDESALEEMFLMIDGDGFMRRHRYATLDGVFDHNRAAYSLSADIVLKSASEIAGDAFLRISQQRYKIDLPIEASPNQARFLAGHEMGHIALFEHYIRLGEAAFKEYRRKISWPELYPEVPYRQQNEAFCDYFSLRLLGFDGIPSEIDWQALPRIDEER